MSKSDRKIVFFDFDGVIVDSFSFCYELINSAGAITEAEYRAKFEGNINDAKEKEIRRFSESDFWKHYKTGLMKCSPVTEISETIKKLSEKYILIIISSSHGKPIAAFLETYKLRGYFTEILGNDVEKSKIKKLRMALDKYSTSPENSLFITDTLGDIREAQKCNIKSIAIAWGYHSIETLAKGNPYKIITKQNEIPATVDDYFKA